MEGASQAPHRSPAPMLIEKPPCGRQCFRPSPSSCCCCSARSLSHNSSPRLVPLVPSPPPETPFQFSPCVSQYDTSPCCASMERFSTSKACCSFVSCSARMSTEGVGGVGGSGGDGGSGCSCYSPASSPSLSFLSSLSAVLGSILTRAVF